MRPTISIPQHWAYPRFTLDQRTEQGTILGLYYYPSGTELAEQFDDGWRYVLMPNKNSNETSYLQEDQIQPLSPEELFRQITLYGKLGTATMLCDLSTSKRKSYLMVQ